MPGGVAAGPCLMCFCSSAFSEHLPVTFPILSGTTLSFCLEACIILPLLPRGFHSWITRCLLRFPPCSGELRQSSVVFLVRGFSPALMPCWQQADGFGVCLLLLLEDWELTALCGSAVFCYVLAAREGIAEEEEIQ